MQKEERKQLEHTLLFVLFLIPLLLLLIQYYEHSAVSALAVLLSS